MILGLTGGIGSGKSTVSKIFKNLGAYIVDADEISHSILAKGSLAYNETIQWFGEKVLNSDGNVNRVVLANIVFGNKAELEALNRITHTHILEVMRDEIKYIKSMSKYEIIVLDVPLLFAPDFDIEYDKSVAIIADEDIRIQRVMARNGISREKVIERMSCQMTNDELKERADYIIENNSDDISSLESKVKELYNRLIRR